MKEQMKVKITTKVEVEVEKEEEYICKRTSPETQDCFFKYTKYKNSSHSERNCCHKEKTYGSGETNETNFSNDED
jgi:hypothetical protein